MTTPAYGGYEGTGSNDIGDTSATSAIPASTYPPLTTDTTVGAPTQTDGTSSGGVREQASQVGGIAKDRAAEVKETTKSSATDVVSTAKQQVGTTVGTAKSQAQQVISETRTQVSQQLTQQQQKAASTLSTFAQGFLDLADGKDTSGPAQDLVREVGTRLQGIASFVENKEPTELVTDLRSFAQQRPEIFLLGAAGIGFVIARFVKGSKEATSWGGTSTGYSTTPSVSDQTGYVDSYAPPTATDAATGSYAPPAPQQDPLAVPSPSWAQEQREGAYRG